MLAQRAVRVHRNGGTDQAEHRDVVGTVGIGRAATQVQTLARGEFTDRLGLRLTVQRAAQEATRVDAVFLFTDSSHRPGQAEMLGNEFGQFDRRR